MKHYMTTLGALAMTVTIVGCATQAATAKMVVQPADVVSRPSAFTKRLAVKNVSGGSETNPLWTSQVDTASFREALQLSLDSASLLSQPPQSATHVLNASLVALEQPLFGFDMTVTCKARYNIVELSSGQKMFEKEIVTPYTAKAGDSFIGSERLKLANEGAVRMNFKQLLQELSEVKPAVTSRALTN
jgi:hypothetical protein